MKKKAKNTTRRMFMFFSITPIVLFCIMVIILFVTSVRKVKIEDTKDLLRSSSLYLVSTYEDMADDADFELEGEDLYIGNQLISGDYEVIDRLKEYADVDLSLFWKDKRVLTTICDKNGDRIINTTATDTWEDHVSYDLEYFDKSKNVNGTYYFAYYVPLHDAQGKVVGMGFAGIPVSEFRRLLSGVVGSCIAFSVALTLVVILVLFIVSQRIIVSQKTILKYLSEIKEGEYKHQMDPALLARNDEYSEMGHIIVKMNDSLEALIYRDALTGLYNRRAGMKLMNAYWKSGKEFSFTICDIDFFKKVNDTYGHNTGDRVLQMVADSLRKNELSDDRYFVARWGGEEFIIVQRDSLENSVDVVEELANVIRNSEVEVNGEKIRVTMSFGITQYVQGEMLDETISRADKLLYRGKETGRNKVVAEYDLEAEEIAELYGLSTVGTGELSEVKNDENKESGNTKILETSKGNTDSVQDN